MRSKILKNSRFILITGFVVFFLFVMVTPVSAGLTIIPNPGETVFIGENNLDITNTMGGYHTIGWWASDANRVQGLLPDKTVDVTNSLHSFYVDPATFVGCTGRWFPLNELGAGMSNQEALKIVDPTLDIKIWNLDSNLDCTGQTIPSTGAHLTFHFMTLLYKAANRDPASADGFITIVVKNESGYVFNHLHKTIDEYNSLTNQRVIVMNWVWGELPGSVIPGDKYWATDLYPAGTYTVYAVSNLNGMRDNYKNGAADYVGKTVSPTYTITLTTPPGGVFISNFQVADVTPSVTTTPVSHAQTLQTSSAITFPVTPTPPSITVAVTSTPTPTITTVAVTPTPTPTITTVAVTPTPIPPSPTITTTPVATGDQGGILNQILNYFKGIFGWK